MGYDVVVLPRISDVELGIRQTKAIFNRFHFDETNCQVGFMYLERYRRKVNSTTGMAGGPLHDETSNAADALRQIGQFYGDKYVDGSYDPELAKQWSRRAHIANQDYNVGRINNTLSNKAGYDVTKINW